MEKRTPHYLLAEIQAQMITIEAMNLTESSRIGVHQAGMGWSDALKVVQGLKRRHFYKSMTTHRDHRVWQDVYHGEWRDKAFYIKFQRANEYFVVSFKEL